MNKSIAVLGVGTIGGSIGADLTRAGHDVLLIDQWPAHVEAMKAHGLHIDLPEEELRVPVRVQHICELSALRPQLDIVFLAAKSYDTCWLVQLIQPYLKPDGVLVSVQNSFNDEWIAPIIGYQRDIASAIELAGEVVGPGRIKRNTDHATTWFILGELHGRITPRLEEIAQILSASGETTTSTNIWGAKWSKLVLNSMMPFDAVTGVRTTEIFDNPEITGAEIVKSRILEFSIRLARETVQVGTTLGYNLEPLFGLAAEDFLSLTDEALKKLMLACIAAVGRESRSHAIQDIERGRRTELDYINGLVARKGQEANVPTPLNESVTSIVRQIEQEILKPDISNLKIMEQCLRE